MPQESTHNTKRLTAIIHDAIGSDASIREGLHDDAAIALMDWGRAQAAHVAARLAAESPGADEETIGSEAGILARLMTTISRAVVYRHKQGDDWLVKVFKRLNKTSQRVYGANAPVMSDAQISDWIAGHAARSDDELLRDLLARFTPPEDTWDSTADSAPLSDALDLPAWPPRLPGRAPHDSPPDVSSDTGDEHD